MKLHFELDVFCVMLGCITESNTYTFNLIILLRKKNHPQGIWSRILKYVQI